MSIQDYTYFLEPGQKVFETIGQADYIFVKFADRPVAITLNNQTVELENGAVYESRNGLFDRFTIQNTDKEAAAIIKLAIGTDRFRTQIITGEITTFPGIRTGDGSVVPDTRNDVALDLISVPGSGLTETVNERITVLYENGLADWLAMDVKDGQGVSEPRSLDYNPAVHENPVAMANSGALNQMLAFEFDPFRKAVTRFLTVVPDLGQQDRFTYYGNVFYQYNDFGTRGVYQKAPGSGWELLISVSNVREMSVTDSGNLILFVGNSIRLYSPQGVLIRSEILDDRDVVLAHINGQLWCFGNTGAPKIFDQELNVLGFGGGAMALNGVGFGMGSYLFSMWTTGTFEDKIQVKATETVVDLFAGKAYLACENAWLGPRPSPFDSVRTTADITVTGAETGNPTVSGQIIKLIFEWYLGQGAVPETYMDLVHGVRITGSTDINGFRYPPIDIKSDGQTFLAAKIPDDFRVIFPITATITLDQRATL